MKWATVITDASFCHKTGKAGWAAWIRIDGVAGAVKQYAKISGKVKTSQEAEKKAAINGIWLAKRHGAEAVLLQTDCMAVVDLVHGVTAKPAPVNQWRQWLRKADLLGFPVIAKHVKGHTDNPDARSWVNRWCDEKANEARRSYS